MRPIALLVPASALLLAGAACSFSETSGTTGGAGGGSSSSSSASSTSSSSSTSSTSSTTSSGTSSGDAGPPCVNPFDQIPLSLLNPFECSGFYTSLIDGVFTPEADGIFTVAHGAATKTISGVSPAIPAGTFVRMRYGCNPGSQEEPGAHVMIENLPDLDGAPNPTETGTRLWYFVAAGGEAYAPPELPFQIDELWACPSTSDGYSYAHEPWTVVLIGEGWKAFAKPTETVLFTEPAGVHAGTYSLHNVNCAYVVFSGGDTGFERNLEIARAD